MTRPTPNEIIIDIAAETYSTDLFPPVDLAVIRALLEREGWTLDQVSAHVARRLLVGWAAHLPERLAEHGYVIVHPDDVAVAFPAPESLFGCTFEEAFEFGCRKMRSHILGDDTNGEPT
jgi:hypothetical protein